jgi:hypothetical protein
MTRKRWFVMIAIFSVIVLMSTAYMVSAQTSSQPDAALTYSGRLANPSGQPVADGSYDFTFTLYASEKDDQALWSETQFGINIKSGKVNVALGQNVPISKDISDRTELWLAVRVRGPQDATFTLLNPRQNLAAPDSVSALTCPHSHFTDYWGGTNPAYGVEVDNSAGTGDGVRGYSGATAYNYAGVYAVNSGGTTAGTGGSGVYAASSYGYGGYFVSSDYRALYAVGNPSWYAAFIENPMGSTSVGLYVNGTMWVTGAKTGYVTDAAINEGPEPLETGDVVVIVGVAEPLVGQIPVIRVRKATAANSTAVAGVVDQGIGMQQGPQDKEAIPGVLGHDASLADNTAIQPGEYLLIVTLGAYKGVKVDATKAPIHPGDLLVISGNAGYASVAVDPKMGTVIGKALGELNSKTGLIPVLVTLK